ncbi:MAG TPA: hypothetical protein VG326_09160 [Tepidisphaeraceae bacterium]|jgi:hypothetical protein|nr:hypothetical protein [Tepidisphaeraceae bacterium]
MATIVYVRTTPRVTKPFSRVVVSLLIGDFLLLVVCALYAAIRGDDPKVGPTPGLILLVLAEIAVPATAFVFIFLLGWLASDYARFRKAGESAVTPEQGRLANDICN